MTFLQITSRVQKLVGDNSPLILTGIGVAGTITTAVLTGKATIKAVEVLNVYRYDQDPKAELFITKKQAVGHTWKLYIQPVASATLTVTAIVLSQRIGGRRAAAMASAYMLSERAFDEYKDKVVEKIGETKERHVREEVIQDRLNDNPVTENSIVVTNGGNALCLEPFSMRYFNSSMEELKKAENDLNYIVINHQYASLTDFYNLIGLERTQVSDDLGWNSDKLLELTFTSALASDGRPCLVVTYQTVPVRDYYLVH